MRTALAAPSRASRSRSPFGDIARIARRAAAMHSVSFEAYKANPEGFQRDVLGYEPIEPQVRVLEAIRNGHLVAVPSGRAMGKSRLDAGIALHFAATQGPNALVVFLAPTFKQIQTILWEELRLLYFGAKVPLGGECAKLANTGLRFPDGSRIFGVTGDKPEALQGLRSPRMLLVCDEASGIPDTTYTALEGNLAGGGKMLLTGNPTRSSGYFREACRDESRFQVVPLPSTSSPNVIAGEALVPGLAMAEWVETRRKEWGEDSALYQIHVLGKFVEQEEGRLFSIALLTAAEQAWLHTKPTGRLVIGIDPAGDGGDGDESAFAPRRGKRAYQILTKRGLSPEGHVTEALGLARELLGAAIHKPENRPYFVIDRDGLVGAKVYAAFVSQRSRNESAFDLRGVRGGARARRMPLQIDRTRDEVWFALLDAVKEGLALPADAKLTRELAAVRHEQHVSGRSKVTNKDDLRRELERSPDRADALALSTWVDPDSADTDEDVPRRGGGGDRDEELFEAGEANPYGGGITPYG